MLKHSVLTLATIVTLLVSTGRASARPAPLFTPHLNLIRTHLPSGWSMRLPEQILLGGPADQEFINSLIVKVLPSNAPPRLTVSLMSCESGPHPCLIGSFSVESQTSDNARRELARHQAAAAPIKLGRGGRGYLLEGQKQNPSYPFSSVMWQQDGMIYTVTFLSSERQNILYMAYSMANGFPIRIPKPGPEPTR